MKYIIKKNFIEIQNTKINFIKLLIKEIIYYLLIFYFHLIIRIKYILLKKKKYEYNLSICAIFKNEAKYLNEWINFHIICGVDHFYLYNNNSDDNFNEILKYYVDTGIVEVINWDEPASQMRAYQDCYQNNKNNTKWLAFIDLDEYICPLKHNTISDWLKKYEKYPSVAVYWKQFGTNGLLKHDNSKLVIEQYTQSWEKMSKFTKMICNMNFKPDDFNNPHLINSRIFKIKIPPINQFKKFIFLDIHRVSFFKKNDVQINHYWSKSFDNFIEQKIKRTDAYHVNHLEMSKIRNNLLFPHENMCTVKDFSIFRFLLQTKLKIYNK